jgi:predicted Fe-Mo cluster-binding NifX family protein
LGEGANALVAVIRCLNRRLCLVHPFHVLNAEHQCKNQIGDDKGGEKLKVVVTATGENLDAQIDPRFGRCQYFIIVDVDSMKYEAVQNESTMASGGAGIQAAQSVAGMGVEAVITGNVGPNAYQTLSASGIRIVTGAVGIVRDAIEKFKKGELGNTSAPTVPGHFGMGGGGGRGMGGGMGRGMGGGMGGGRGR